MIWTSRQEIVKEYHPSAILDPQILPLRDFLADSTSKQSSLFDSHPWHPFSSQLDFDLAEFILRTGMNHQARSDFFSIIDRCGGSQSTEFTIRNENDLAEAWSRAENLFTKFKKETISVPYKNEVRNYDVHYRPLWDWTLDLLRDKDLAPHFVWDAVHLFREDKNGIRTWFFNEPWSGNIFWEVQSSLPPNGKPLAYILYADKSRLSSFGTAKGYPNFGGGCVVGWLPIVEEEEDHKGKPSWINFKRVVWHEAFRKILGSLAQYSRSGYAFQPPNSDKVIILYPFILILSADYEEHCMMTLTRGGRANYPCPVCLIPLTNLSDLSITYPLRTTESMKEIYDRACLLNADQAEELLKLHGLHKVPNIFWEIERSNPYRAVSWDRLHAFQIGLFDHLLSRLIEHVDRFKGRDAKVKIDEVNLTHFTSVFSFDFADGKKYEHMSRQILFAAQAVLTKAADPAGYLLLKCIRSHLELDVYAAMDVHTEDTIKAGQSIMQVFGERMKDSDFQNPTHWDIPKMHTQQHLFSDIQGKGVTKNYNTKINESMHGPLKKAYQIQTNFKNVADQILQTDHRYNVAMQIRQKVDRWKKHTKYKSDLLNADDDLPEEKHFTIETHKAYLHSPKKTSKDPSTFSELENAFSHDLAYDWFRIRLGGFMTGFLNRVSEGCIAKGKKIHYSPNDKAKLIQLFECEFNEQKYPLALVHPYDAPVTDGHLRWKHQRDKDLGFYRVRACP
ncbi:uncharacterized protein EV420DRAFT_1621072 [Desarmillaria tabescens]|uniref:Uncharacterized protein n=1 Tax=Armillaria tabescens TaxID=1929756 RepID=A0AA39N474_ARMTA|nr:uncharacterized protein EV420DRAFT_1621072 [Desarmillaria tabescens]KAK0457561.1 hypothetical protein EV420DRAFT_1621072 [Desarmillaria tabescens]